MVWVLSVLLYVHVLGAIFWFGSGMTMQFIFARALPSMTYEAQHAWAQVLAANYGRVIGPVGGFTVLFGILRGVFAGVLSSLNTPYGITFVVAFVLAIPVIVVGARFLGPIGQQMAAAATREEVLAHTTRFMRMGRYEQAGMFLMLALMVAMHAGY